MTLPLFWQIYIFLNSESPPESNKDAQPCTEEKQGAGFGNRGST